MTVRWITEYLGTAPAASMRLEPGVAVLDVRELVDKGGNDPERVRQKIAQGIDVIRTGKRLVICCDYGISRSNAIAAGILAKLRGTTVDQSVRDIIAATGEGEIKIELLDIARAVVEGPARGASDDEARRVLLTGGDGFLGRVVAEQFRRMKVEVVAPSSRELDLITGRAELDMLVRSKCIGSVVHLANPRVYTSNLALGETLVMLRNVLEVCSRNDAWLLYPSGWEVYSGYPATRLLADESLPLHASGPYGETKVLCETLIGHFRRAEGLNRALLRSSPVYGPGSNRPKFIFTFIEKARKGESITTHRYINAEPALDLLHVTDIARAIAKTVAVRFVGDLNIGTGTVSSTRQIAEWIVQWLKSLSTIDIVPIRRNVANIAMDYGKAKREVGWCPEITVEDGVRAVVEQVVCR